MSESLLALVQAYTLKRDSASVAGMGEANNRDSDESNVHFHDFLSQVNPPQASQAIHLAQVTTDGGEMGGVLGSPERVAALTQENGGRQIGDAGLGADGMERLYGLKRTASQSREVQSPNAQSRDVQSRDAQSRDEAWTFIAPTVPPQVNRRVVDASSAYRIYAKTLDNGVNLAKEPVASNGSGGRAEAVSSKDLSLGPGVR